MARLRHTDVEYSVDWPGNTMQETVYDNFADAAKALVSLCTGSGKATLNVLIFSEAGARFYGGDTAVEQYLEDPEASVFERFEFKCNAVGRVP